MPSPSPNANAACCLLLILVCAMLPACKANSSLAKTRSGSRSDPEATIHLDLMCLGDHINNPPENFHYSYQFSDATASIDTEAEITPQTIDVIAKEKSGTHAYHGVRTDEASWNAAVLDLSSLKLTSMAARLDSLNGTSAITVQGAESLNGYSTMKYLVDTTRANSADQHRYTALFGQGSFEKGTVWQAPDGCAVKAVLDDSVVTGTGTVKQGHFEIARSKKQ